MEAQGDCTLLSFPSATPFTWGTFFVPEGMFSGVDNWNEFAQCAPAHRKGTLDSKETETALRTVVLKMHFPETGKKCRFLDPTNHNSGVGPGNLCFKKPSSWFSCMACLDINLMVERKGRPRD